MRPDKTHPVLEIKDLFLRKEGQILGLHATGFVSDDDKFHVRDAWCVAYDSNLRFLANLYKLTWTLEAEIVVLEADGWVVFTPENDTF